MMKRFKWFKEIVWGASFVFIVSLAAGLTMGAVWGVVDWLRNYGAGIVHPFPYFDRSPVIAPAFRSFSEGSLIGQLENFLSWHNMLFRGATRFGAGIGMIAGAIVAMGWAKSKPNPCRIAAGLTAGAIIGGRSVLLLTSDAPHFLVGTIAGTIILALYLRYWANGYAALPRIVLPAPGSPGQIQ